MDELLKWVISKNKEYSSEKIILSSYCERKIKQRAIEEDLVRKTLTLGNPIYVTKQEKKFQGAKEDRYKVIYKISVKYYLIIIISYNQSILKVINVIKTSKNLESKWQKNIKKF